MNADPVEPFRRVVALSLGGACLAAAYVGMSALDGSSHNSVGRTLRGMIVFSPFIVTQAFPLALYWRTRRSFAPSVLSGVLMSVALLWVYVGHSFAMLRPGPLLAMWYPFAAFFLTLAQVPGLIWKSRRPTTVPHLPPRPDIPTQCSTDR